MAGKPPRTPEVEGSPISIIRFSGILSNSNPLPEPDPEVAGVVAAVEVVGQLPLLEESVSDPYPRLSCSQCYKKILNKANQLQISGTRWPHESLTCFVTFN